MIPTLSQPTGQSAWRVWLPIWPALPVRRHAAIDSHLDRLVTSGGHQYLNTLETTESAGTPETSQTQYGSDVSDGGLWDLPYSDYQSSSLRIMEDWGDALSTKMSPICQMSSATSGLRGKPSEHCILCRLNLWHSFISELSLMDGDKMTDWRFPRIVSFLA